MTRRRALLSAAAAWPLAAGAASAQRRPGDEPGGGTAPRPGLAPTGDQISEQRIPLYHRGTPVVGLSGPLADVGVREAKRVGFAAIVDLQPDPARAADERRNAEFARIRYHHLPVRGPAPGDEEVRRFAELLTDHANLPVLVHGAGVDQAGAMWALYRAHLGVPPPIALLDGETAGLSAGAEAVRARLGLPPAAR